MTPLLEFEAVSFRHRRRGRRAAAVLQDVSFSLQAGEMGGVWSDRGGGKTTLAKLAAGALFADAGRVLFDGKDLRELAAGPRGNRDLRALIGFASRSGPELTQLTPEEWIASSLATSLSWRKATEHARQALERVGVRDVGGDEWSTLSDSEQMLVAIAHACVRGPRLLVVDDPVGGLGPLRRSEILGLLRSIADTGVTVLITAGDIAHLAGLDRIWSLDCGRLEGSPERPMASVVPLRGTGA
jgi:ABC-type multidrug transport system ATPase subunit